MDIYEFLESSKIEFSRNVPLSTLINFRLGGNANIVCFPNSTAKLTRLLKFISTEKLKFYIIGNGTNLIASDDGFDGIVIKLCPNMNGYKITGSKVYAEAGLNLFDFNRLLSKHNLKGMEFSFGIPGSIGGAVSMNAGAYGHTVSEFIESVKVFDGKKIRTLKVADLNYSHRSSAVFDNQLVVIGATFVLSQGEQKEIENQMQFFMNLRKERQPYLEPCAGSVFRRLENGDLPVSKLIDDLGLKGTKDGDAEVSLKHAGFIVNKGKATCQNVLNLVEYIKEQVKSHYGYDLELEIKILGDTNGIIW